MKIRFYFLRNLVLAFALSFVVSCASKKLPKPEQSQPQKPQVQKEEPITQEKITAAEETYMPEGQKLGAEDYVASGDKSYRSSIDSKRFVADRVFFAYDSYDLNDESIDVLRDQAEWLKGNDVKITIEGHCDERGTREYNIALGERRANSAKQYLVLQGVSESRLFTVSYGKERPAVVGSTPDIWKQNRRAVAVVR